MIQVPLYTPPPISPEQDNTYLKKRGGKQKMSVSESISEDSKKVIYFHGKDVRDKKFQKMMRKKASLTKAILINTAIITGLIFIIFVIVLLGA